MDIDPTGFGGPLHLGGIDPHWSPATNRSVP